MHGLRRVGRRPGSDGGVILEKGTAAYEIWAGIHLGIQAEQDSGDPNIISPEELTNDQIAWLASWLAGEGFHR